MALHRGREWPPGLGWDHSSGRLTDGLRQLTSTFIRRFGARILLERLGGALLGQFAEAIARLLNKRA